METKIDRVEKDQNEQAKANQLYQRALQAAQVGRTERAIEEFKHVSALFPNVSSPYNNLGILYQKEGRLDEAIEAYRRAISLRPEAAEAHYNLGLAYRKKGLFREAEREYQEAIRRQPDFSEAHYNLGILYDLYLDQPDKAGYHYRQYLRSGGQKRQEVELWISILEKRSSETPEEKIP